MSLKSRDFSFSATFLTPQDAEPIICALDLVAAIPADTPEQDRLNFFNCNVVVQKLRAGNLAFTPNEWRVIGAGVGTALELLSGVGSPCISFDTLEPEWQNDLRRYVLVYNRLCPHLDRLYQELEKAFHPS